MATSIKTIIESEYRGAGFNQAINQLFDLEKVSKKTGLSMDALAGGAAVAGVALGAMAAAGKFAINEIQKGAAIEQTSERFEKLAVSIGTTADALRNDMKEATRGTVSNAQLLAAGTDIINLGLAKSHDGVVRLSRVVGELGLDMNQLTLTLANDSTARLDSLGLSIEGVNAKMAELEGQGVSTAESFDLAVLESLEDKLDLVGASSDSAASNLKVLAASYQDVADAFSSGAAQAAADELALLGDSAANTSKGLQIISESSGKALVNTLINLVDPMGTTRIFLDKLGGSAIDTDEAMGQLASSTGELAAEAGKVPKAVKDAEDRVKDLGFTLDFSGNQMALWASEADGFESAVNSAFGGDLINKAAVDLSGLDFSLDFSSNQMALWASEADGFKEAADAAFGGSIDTSGLEELPNALDNSTAAMEAQAAMLDRLNEATGNYFSAALAAKPEDLLFRQEVSFSTEVGGRTSEQNDALAKLQDAYRKTSEDIANYQSGVSGFGETQESIAKKIADSSEEASFYAGKIAELQAIQGEYSQTTVAAGINQDVFNQHVFESADAAGANALQLGILAEQLGIVEDASSGVGEALAKALIDSASADFAATGNVDALTEALERAKEVATGFNLEEVSNFQKFEPLIEEDPFFRIKEDTPVAVQALEELTNVGVQGFGALSEAGGAAFEGINGSLAATSEQFEVANGVVDGYIEKINQIPELVKTAIDIAVNVNGIPAGVDPSIAGESAAGGFQ